MEFVAYFACVVLLKLVYSAPIPRPQLVSQDEATGRRLIPVATAPEASQARSYDILGGYGYGYGRGFQSPQVYGERYYANPYDSYGYGGSSVAGSAPLPFYGSYARGYNSMSQSPSSSIYDRVYPHESRYPLDYRSGVVGLRAVESVSVPVRFDVSDFDEDQAADASNVSNLSYKLLEAPQQAAPRPSEDQPKVEEPNKETRA